MIRPPITSVMLRTCCAAFVALLASCSGGGDDGNHTAKPTSHDEVEVIENETYVPGPARNARAEPSSTPTIPVIFQGRYAGTAEQCGQSGDTEELTVTGDRLRFYESEGIVTGVTVVSERQIRIAARFSGEGQSWAAARALSLSEDGRTLLIDGQTRVRC